MSPLYKSAEWLRIIKTKDDGGTGAVGVHRRTVRHASQTELNREFAKSNPTSAGWFFIALAAVDYPLKRHNSH